MVDTASPAMCMPLAHSAAPWTSKAAGTTPGEQTRRILYGELDIDSVTRLQPDLFHVLLHSAAGLDLDLGAVTFSDCSGVNLLLRLHRQATQQGKTLIISAMSPAMERILDLTGTRILLASQTAVPRSGRRPPDQPWSGEDLSRRA